MRTAGLVLALLASALLASTDAREAQGNEWIESIRVHGNHTSTDEDVIKLAGVSPGDPVTDESLAQVVRRLRATGRFERVEVRKRYRSLTDATQVAVILLVQDYPSADPGVSVPGPMRRMKDSMMFLPILGYTDGYGFTYGGRASFVDVLGSEGRVSVPLTWGGTKRAAVEVEKGFSRGPISRLQGGASISRRENPHFELNDDRRQIWVGADREIVRGLRAGVQAGWTDVDFGPAEDPLVRLSDRFTTVGADVTVDTRHDPVFPRNAVYARAGWEALSFRGGGTVNRYRTDARGYVGLIGQSVLSLRVRHDGVDRPLPAYEQALLGGASTLRGHRAGAFAGDNLFATSAELRLPLGSPMRVSRAGVRVFVDAGAVYDDGARLRDAAFQRGVGAGVFLLATVFQLNLDVARGLGHGTRVHLMTGFHF